MLILGDLACPNETMAQQLSNCISEMDIFKEQFIICNLEGVICDTNPKCDEKLFNHPEVLKIFEPQKTMFSLANNHTYDYPELIETTKHLLETEGFSYNGLMKGKKSVPTTFEIDGKKYALFTHCWRVYTETNPNMQNTLRVIDKKYKDFFIDVSDYIQEYPEQRIICYFHWNYDLEILPFPMYRQLAHDLVDVGAYAVIGNHSHVPQGGEVYKERPIVYGLGNFFIPSDYFFNGRLKYPNESKKMMVLEIPEDDARVCCHWFFTDKEKPLEYICSEDLKTGEIILEYSPYRDMDSSEYIRYFKANRRKRFLVPVFDSYKGALSNIKEFAAISRIKIIKRIKGS